MSGHTVEGMNSKNHSTKQLQPESIYVNYLVVPNITKINETIFNENPDEDMCKAASGFCATALDMIESGPLSKYFGDKLPIQDQLISIGVMDQMVRAVQILNMIVQKTDGTQKQTPTDALLFFYFEFKNLDTVNINTVYARLQYTVFRFELQDLIDLDILKGNGLVEHVGYTVESHIRAKKKLPEGLVLLLPLTAFNVSIGDLKKRFGYENHILKEQQQNKH